ncbi:MAG: dimethylarginine dimethylaminohydrolase family protein [Pyrinomonadaceae bacterium]
MFSKAIVRLPSENFADGLTSVDLGVPDFEKALGQHRAYCEALVRCGLQVIELKADARYPDSTFVEDTAILTERCAVITRPGAASRSGETANMAETLSTYYDRLDRVEAPGTVDGGDVCQIETRFLIGISERTNEAGARQLSSYLEASGFTYSHIDFRETDGLLHLKSGISYLGENRVLVTDSLADRDELEGYEQVDVPEGEEYAANCIRVNDYLLFAVGFPKLRNKLESLSYKIIELEMSEFQKMDGGLSCLSLRF